MKEQTSYEIAKWISTCKRIKLELQLSFWHTDKTKASPNGIKDINIKLETIKQIVNKVQTLTYGNNDLEIGLKLLGK